MSINKLKNAWISNDTGLTGGVSLINEGKTKLNGGIDGSTTQTINFGSNAPTMVGTNISNLNDNALSSNIPKLNTANTYTLGQIFNNTIAGDAIQITRIGTSGYMYLTTYGTIGFFNGAGNNWSIDYAGNVIVLSTSNWVLTNRPNTYTYNNTFQALSTFSGDINITGARTITGIGNYTGTNTFQGSTTIKSLYDLGITTSSSYSVKISNSLYGTTSSTTGYSNVLIGNKVLNNATNAMNRTVAIGESALENCTSGDQCVAIGYFALASVTTGGLNTGIGSYSLFQLTSGIANFALGNASGGGLRAGCNYNYAIGNSTLASLADNINGCIAMGYFAVANIKSNITGNVGIGNNALNGAGGSYNNVNYLSGSYNTAIGYDSGKKCSANSNGNSFFGAYSDFNTITDPLTPTEYNYSTAIGYGSIINGSYQIKMGRSTETVVFAGNANFNVNLPTSSLTPTLSSQLITKGFADTNYANLLGNNGFYGINSFTPTTLSNAIRVNTYNIPNAFTYLRSDGSIGYTPDDLLTSNWSINSSGLLTLKGGINVSTTQTINFGSNAPTMLGTNITGIPDSAITNSGNYAKKNVGNTFTVSQNFNGGGTGDIITVPKTGTGGYLFINNGGSIGVWNGSSFNWSIDYLGNITSPTFNNYVLTTALTNYVLSSSLTSTLSNYVLSSSLTSTLSNYVNLNSINTFTNTNTFSIAPIMSGSNISTGTIDTKSISSTGSLFNHSYTLYNSLTASIPTSNTITTFNTPTNNTLSLLPILLYTFTVPSYWSSGTNRSITVNCPVVLNVSSNRLTTGAVLTQTTTASVPTSIQVFKNGSLFTTITLTNLTPTYQLSKTMNMNSTLSTISYQYFAYEISFTYVIPVSNNDVYTFFLQSTFNVNNNGNTGLICNSFSFITNASSSTSVFTNCSYSSGSDTTGFIQQSYYINNNIPATLNAFVGCESITCASILNMNSTSTKNTSSTGVNGLVQITCYSSVDNPVGQDGIGIKAFTNTGNIINFANTTGTLRGAIVGSSATAVLYNTTSDERLKENIITMPSQLENIKSLSARSFNWKSTGDEETGFIAQEIYKVYPDLNPLRNNDKYDDKLYPTKSDGTDFIHMVDYGRMTPYLWSAVQELTLIVEKQQNQINKLMEELKISI